MVAQQAYAELSEDLEVASLLAELRPPAASARRPRRSTARTVSQRTDVDILWQAREDLSAAPQTDGIKAELGELDLLSPALGKRKLTTPKGSVNVAFSRTCLRYGAMCERPNRCHQRVKILRHQ